jgi:hypothetical protein
MIGRIFFLGVLGVLAVSFIAQAQNQKPGDAGFSYGDLRQVTLQGKIISLGDEMTRKYGARIAGAGAEKQWALALPEGQLYTFLDNENYRKLVAANLGNQAVEVQARQFPRSMLLEITAFKAIPAETIKRRFYCGVCAIYTDDFGPCACCGQEVEVVKQ